MIRTTCRVLSADARKLVVTAPGWPGHRPGQFAMVRLSTRLFDPLLPRPLAVFRGDADALEFQYKVVGRGTAILAQLPVGAELGLVGPLGNGFPEPTGRAWLVGGGTGIASLYELARAAKGRVRVALGGRTRADILGLDEFEALGADLAIATEDGSLGHRGLVTDLVRPEAVDEVFVCGPNAMMRAVADLAVGECWVSLENQMACGFGICLGCAVQAEGAFRYVCTDGPVFRARDVDWDGLP